MSQGNSSEKTTLQTRKDLGLAHLNADRVEEGLKIYATILRDYPEDVESYIVIGDCYLAQGEMETASQLYAYALELSPGNAEVIRRLRLVRTEKGAKNGSGEVPVPELRTIGRVLQRIMGKTATVTEQEMDKAAKFLDEIRQSERPALAVAERLGEIEDLIPALLELNVRQARAEGRPELAHALDDLLVSVREQLTSSATSIHANLAAKQSADLSYSSSKAHLLFLVPSTYQISNRAILVYKALMGRGYIVTLASTQTDLRQKFDAVIAFNPHGDAQLMEFMAACASAKIPIILDLEDDFEEMPLTHPSYHDYGLATAEKTRIYMAAMMLASVISTPGAELAEKISTIGHTAKVIPHSWMKRNGLWDKPITRRHTVNLGWLGTREQVEDVASVRRMILRVLREFPYAQLIVGGDAQVYQLFDRLPESRRIFLPPAQPDDYPYLLGQMDILLVPMRDTLFNRMQSDMRLMEAGIRRIPWIASPMPAFLAWSAGGLITHNPEDWVTHLRQLVQEPQLRISLGNEGWQKAEQREMNQQGELWQLMVEELLERYKKNQL